MKYKTIGAIKNVQNIPYCKATADLIRGTGVVLDRINKTAIAPANADEAKKVTYIVANIVDRPEAWLDNSFVTVHEGEFVKADDFRTVNGLEVVLGQDEVKTNVSTLVANDNLVIGVGGKWEKATDVEGYAVVLRTIKKETEGVLCEIIA